MSRGRLQVALAGAVAVVALAAGAFWLGGRGQAGNLTTAAAAPTSTRAPDAVAAPVPRTVASPSSVAPVPDGRIGSPAMTQAQADAISSAFTSGDTGRIAAQLAGGVRKEYEASPGPVLSAGEALTIGAADVQVTGEGRAAGLVRSQGSAGSTRWAVSMLLENGRWKVLEMMKVSAP